MIKIQFEFDNRFVKHLKEKSWYDHNYYEIDLNKHGDYFSGSECNIVYEEYDEFANCYTYSLGYFKNSKFQSMFSWLSTQQDSLFKNISA